MTLVKHLQTLIQNYPFYGTSGLLNAQEYIRFCLEKSPWDSVYMDNFVSSDISDDTRYVKVADFGPPYTNYETVQKHNLIAIKDGGKPGPTLIFNGHVDVDIVDESKKWFQPEGWKSGILRDDKVYGRGATDMLGGLLAQMTSACRFIETYPEFSGRIVFVSVCDEEIGGNGTLRSLLQLESQGYLENPSLAVIAEPTQNKVCFESLGFMHISIRCFSNPIHMGLAKRHHNSLNTAFDLISKFDVLLKNCLKEKNILYSDDQFKVNFGKINGGIDPAIPIGDLFLEGTIFFPEIINADDLFVLIKNSLENNFPVCVCNGNFGFPGASFEGEIKSKFMGAECDVFPSPCDARLFKSFNIPTVIWGPGSLEQAHSVDEFIKISDLEEYESSLYRWMCNFLR